MSEDKVEQEGVSEIDLATMRPCLSCITPPNYDDLHAYVKLVLGINLSQEADGDEASEFQQLADAYFKWVGENTLTPYLTAILAAVLAYTSGAIRYDPENCMRARE